MNDPSSSSGPAATAIERLAAERLQQAAQGGAGAGLLQRWGEGGRDVPKDLPSLRRAMGADLTACMRYLGVLRGLIPRPEWNAPHPPPRVQAELLVACMLAGLERFVRLRWPELSAAGPDALVDPLAPSPLKDPVIAPLVMALRSGGGLALAIDAGRGDLRPLNVIQEVADPELKFGSAGDRFRAALASVVDLLAGHLTLEQLTGHINELAQRGIPEDAVLADAIELLRESRYAQPVFALPARSAGAQQVTPALQADLDQAFGVPVGVYGADAATPAHADKFARFEGSVRYYLDTVIAALQAAPGATAPSPAATRAPAPLGKPTVFLSYAHADDVAGGWVEHVRAQFGGVQQPFELWDDKSIRPGDQWNERIQAELERARAALILISASALGSQYIVNEELQRIKARHEQRQMRAFWLLIDTCDWQQDAWLCACQSATGTKPLATLERPVAIDLMARAVGDLRTFFTSSR